MLILLCWIFIVVRVHNVDVLYPRSIADVRMIRTVWCVSGRTCLPCNPSNNKSRPSHIYIFCWYKDERVHLRNLQFMNCLLRCKLLFILVDWVICYDRHPYELLCHVRKAIILRLIAPSTTNRQKHGRLRQKNETIQTTKRRQSVTEDDPLSAYSIESNLNLIAIRTHYCMILFKYDQPISWHIERKEKSLIAH